MSHVRLESVHRKKLRQLRLSVGLESPRDLIRDLDQALGAIDKPPRRR